MVALPEAENDEEGWLGLRRRSRALVSFNHHQLGCHLSTSLVGQTHIPFSVFSLSLSQFEQLKGSPQNSRPASLAALPSMAPVVSPSFSGGMPRSYTSFSLLTEDHRDNPTPQLGPVVSQSSSLQSADSLAIPEATSGGDRQSSGFSSVKWPLPHPPSPLDTPISSLDGVSDVLDRESTSYFEDVFPSLGKEADWIFPLPRACFVSLRSSVARSQALVDIRYSACKSFCEHTRNCFGARLVHPEYQSILTNVTAVPRPSPETEHVSCPRRASGNMDDLPRTPTATVIVLEPSDFIPE